MSKDFWTGLFLSVPLSIVANLLVDPIKRFWAKYIKSQKTAATETLKIQYWNTVAYRDNPHLFDKIMFHALIMFASGCARVGVAATIAFVLRVLLGPGRGAYWMYLLLAASRSRSSNSPRTLAATFSKFGGASGTLKTTSVSCHPRSLQWRVMWDHDLRF